MTTIPTYPELLLKNKKSEIYQSSNNIKQPLLNMGEFKNIFEAKRVLGVNNANEVYELLLDDWNRFVDNENRNRINKYKKELKKYNEEQVKIFNEKAKTESNKKINKAEEKKNKPKLFLITKSVIQETIMINVVLENIYISNKNGKAIHSKPYIVERTVSPFTINQNDKPDENITKIIISKIDDFANPYKIVKLLSYKIVVMDTQVLQEKYKKPRSKVMMKNSFILKNDWLSYSKGIMKEAYEETENKCVYYQLEKLLLNPPTGNPTKFINRERTSQEALYNYFNQTNEEEDEDFCIKSGVSTEMIAKLCKDIKRNMYAYDEDNKCFYNVLSNDSKHYCPIVFYCMNGHFYLINDPKCIRSVSESNKPTAKKINSSSIEN